MNGCAKLCLYLNNNRILVSALNHQHYLCFSTSESRRRFLIWCCNVSLHRLYFSLVSATDCRATCTCHSVCASQAFSWDIPVTINCISLNIKICETASQSFVVLKLNWHFFCFYSVWRRLAFHVLRAFILCIDLLFAACEYLVFKYLSNIRCKSLGVCVIHPKVWFFWKCVSYTKRV